MQPASERYRLELPNGGRQLIDPDEFDLDEIARAPGASAVGWSSSRRPVELLATATRGFEPPISAVGPLFRVAVRTAVPLRRRLCDRHQRAADDAGARGLLQDAAPGPDLLARPPDGPPAAGGALRHVPPRDGPPHRIHRARHVPRPRLRPGPGADAQPALLADPRGPERALGRVRRGGREPEPDDRPTRPGPAPPRESIEPFAARPSSLSFAATSSPACLVRLDLLVDLADHAVLVDVEGPALGDLAAVVDDAVGLGDRLSGSLRIG